MPHDQSDDLHEFGDKTSAETPAQNRQRGAQQIAYHIVEAFKRSYFNKQTGQPYKRNNNETGDERNKRFADRRRHSVRHFNDDISLYDKPVHFRRQHCNDHRDKQTFASEQPKSECRLPP